MQYEGLDLSCFVVATYWALAGVSIGSAVGKRIESVEAVSRKAATTRRLSGGPWRLGALAREIRRRNVTESYRGAEARTQLVPKQFPLSACASLRSNFSDALCGLSLLTPRTA